MESTTLQHQTDPLNQLCFHELVVILFYLREDLPDLWMQDLIHDGEDLPNHKVFVDEHKEEALCQRFILEKLKAVVGTNTSLIFKDLSSCWSKELSLLHHIFIQVCYLSSNVNVVLIVDTEIFQIDLRLLLLLLSSVSSLSGSKAH